MKRWTMLLVAVSFLAIACGQSEQPKEPPTPPPVEKFNAKNTFETSCAPCHGVGGKGDGPAAASLSHKPANLTSQEIQAKSNDKLAATIRNGTEKGMPPWKQFSDEEIKALVKYLRELGKKK